MNYKKAKNAGTVLITAGIAILLCALFFIFFGTKTMINEAYLAGGNASGITDDSTLVGNDEEVSGIDGNGSETTENQQTGTTAANTGSEHTAQEEQTPQNTAQKDASQISIPGIKELKIQKNSQSAAVDFYNPGSNNCYFEISIILKDSGKEIYKSGTVRPGQHIYEIELTQGLAAGSYDAVLHYDAFTADGNYTELNGADVEFKLIAE